MATAYWPWQIFLKYTFEFLLIKSLAKWLKAEAKENQDNLVISIDFYGVTLRFRLDCKKRLDTHTDRQTKVSLLRGVNCKRRPLPYLYTRAFTTASEIGFGNP